MIDTYFQLKCLRMMYSLWVWLYFFKRDCLNIKMQNLIVERLPIFCQSNLEINAYDAGEKSACQDKGKKTLIAGNVKDVLKSKLLAYFRRHFLS